MSLTKAVIRFAAPVPKVEAFERYLFIGTHPDDIEVGAGATVAKLAAEGKEICFLICTDGRYGDEYAPKGITENDLAELRKKEALDSAKLLGITDVRFLGLSDGGFYSEEELLTGIAKVIGDFKPDILLTVDPDVKTECHADHLNTGRAVKKLAFFAPFQKIMDNYKAASSPVKAVAFFMTAKPNRFVKTGHFFAKQLEALFTCFPSQYPKENPASASVKLYLTLRVREYGIRHLCSAAEGFRVLGVTQMHCLPEGE